MNGDFARVTFDPSAAYSRVLLQQGRVLLESDFNEQSAIHLHFLRTLIIDLVGRAWRAGEESFKIQPADGNDFRIGSGRFYVDGIPCENTSQDRTYRKQSDQGPLLGETGPSDAGFLVYLECWERHLSAVQRPALREVALGGADTATRAKIEWQVRVLDGEQAKRRADDAARALQERQNSLPEGAEKARAKAEAEALAQAYDKFSKILAKKPAPAQDKDTCKIAQAVLDGMSAAGPSLRARARHDASEDDPCAISAEAEFRSRENQLYRVEVHRGGLAGNAGATFKWSRENGSVLFAIRSIADAREGSGYVVRLESMGRDRRGGLCEGDWVELTGDAVDLARAAPVMCRIESIDQERQTLTIMVADGEEGKIDSKVHNFLRRWDQCGEKAAAGSVAIVESASETSGWIALERGVEIQFAPGAIYNPGDYWLVPARVASRDVEWRRAEGGIAEWYAKQGTIRHRAALAIGRKGTTADKGLVYQSCGCTVTSLCQQLEK